MPPAGVIDAHTHFIPPTLAIEAERRPAWGIQVVVQDGLPWVTHEQGFVYPLDPTFLGGEAKLADMRERRIDLSVISLAPSLFLYWLAPAEAEAFARYANDELARAVAESGGGLAGLATLPMQSPESAAEELRRGVEELALVGAHIGTDVEGVTLGDRRFTPVLEAAEALGATLMLHPYYVGPKPGLDDYYLTNLLGNPVETTLAAARLIFSGALDRHPQLKLVLVHAGGFLPYQVGRLDHGWTVRAEPRAQLERPPSEYLDRFHFDTITHHDGALRWLVESIGAERLLLGTDLPYDMGDPDPVGRLDRLALAPAAHARIAAVNAAELFRIGSSQPVLS